MSLLVCSLVVTFFTVVLTGPAGVEWLAKRRAARLALEEHPAARVVYLPPGRCRSEGSVTLPDGTSARFPVLDVTDRAVIVLVTITGSWGFCTSRLDTQKRMFIDAVPEDLVQSKDLANAVVDCLRSRRREGDCYALG